MNHNLTPRQMEIVCLVARGYMQKEVAEELGINIKTVQKILQDAYRRLGIHDNVRLTHVALARGWILNIYADEM